MFTSQPCLGILPKPDLWVLLQPLTWDAFDLKLTLPVGWVSDLASIPKVLRNVLDVDGMSRCPALLHDGLYNCQQTSRAFADAQLRRALELYGESSFTAGVYWAGVRVGGWKPWDDRMARGGGMQASDFLDVPTYQRFLATGTKLVTFSAES